MDSTEAAKTLILKGKPVQFPKEQADLILDLQKRTGFTDYKEPDAEQPADEPQTTVTEDADHGQPGDQVDSDTSKRGGSKKSS